MLLLDKPSRLMLGYLLGAYVTSITIGLVIVFTLSNSSTTNTTQNTIGPAVDIALGAIAWPARSSSTPGATNASTNAGERAKALRPIRPRRGGSGS